MGSSFSLYLNEGLIKLPPKLTQSMTDYFTYWYLAFLEGLSEVDKSYDEDDREMIKIALDRLAKKHGSKNPTAIDIKKTMTNRAIFKNFPVEDIPSQYIEKVAKVKGTEAIEQLKKAHIKFVVAFRPHPKVTDDEEGIFYAEPAEIIISIPNMPINTDKILKLLSLFNHAEASRNINNTLGIVEHELMHAVQSMVLYVLHKDQYSNKGRKSIKGLRTDQANQDKYFTDDIEFSPWIKTSSREIKSIFGKYKATTDQEKKELFTKFTFGDVLGKNVSKADNKKFERSAFFKSLKRSDPIKWKKAVKLLSTEVLN